MSRVLKTETNGTFRLADAAFAAKSQGNLDVLTLGCLMSEKLEFPDIPHLGPDIFG